MLVRDSHLPLCNRFGRRCLVRICRFLARENLNYKQRSVKFGCGARAQRQVTGISNPERVYFVTTCGVRPVAAVTWLNRWRWVRLLALHDQTRPAHSTPSGFGFAPFQSTSHKEPAHAHVLTNAFASAGIHARRPNSFYQGRSHVSCESTCQRFKWQHAKRLLEVDADFFDPKHYIRG